MNPSSFSRPIFNRAAPRRNRLPVAALATVLALLALPVRASDATPPATSEWVHAGPDGRLVYKTTPAGDRILDFSSAGYHGGGVALPDVPVQATVKPTGTDDDTAAIQEAIDRVSALPVRNGFRGAVLLEPGTFVLPRMLTLTASGVVLRGSGSALDGGAGTTLKLVGGRHVAVTIGTRRGGAARSSRGKAAQRAARPDAAETDHADGFSTTITDRYVPSGVSTFNVADGHGFAIGDLIAIRRPTTKAWVHFMQMDAMPRVGRPSTWVGEGRVEITERRITGISGNRLTVDIPVADSYDATYLNPPGTTVVKITPDTAVTEVGVEHLHFQCPPLEIAYGEAPYAAVRVNGNDCWLRDLYCEETMNTTALAGKRITVEGVVVKHTFPNLGASKPSDFSIEGNQILIDRCEGTGGNTYFVWTAALLTGPNVVLNCTFHGYGSRIQPHMRWSTGLLVDNCTVADGGIDFMNRGVAGSGHGWTMGWAVAWNCIAESFVIQNPPGAVNWAIGCIGQPLDWPRMFDRTPVQPKGIFDSQGTPVAPQSLYLAQLQERLGPSALAAIGYRANSVAEFANKHVPRSPALAREDDPELGPDLALHRPLSASAIRGKTREFSGERAVDGDPATYWATNDGVHSATLEIDLEGPVELDAALLAEPAGRHAITSYKIEGMGTSDWETLAQGTTVGERKVERFPRNLFWKIRLTITGEPNIALRKVGLYLAPGTAAAAKR